MGTWIIRPDEPQESVEDPFGVQRPADLDDKAVPDELADALADLPETRVVTTPEAAREVLAAEGPAPRGPRPPAGTANSEGVVYPEWDYRAGSYRLEGAVVREVPIIPGDGAWARDALTRHATLVRRVRRQFAHLRPRRVRVRRQPDGSDIDLEAWVETWADRRAGVAEAASEDRLYVAERPARRSLAIALLIDVSASTDSWVAGNRRVIDVEKEALLVVGEALERLDDRYGIFAFSGEGPGGVRVQVVKDFADRGGLPAARRIERLEPERYTRVGAAVRHVTARLAAEPAQRRLLLVLTDGRPNDVDQYEGRYGVEDTARAVREAGCDGILVFGLTVDRTAPAYVNTMFGPGRAALLRRSERLPGALVEVLRRLVGST
jgi:nitric oxide reductase NorD protein